MHIVNAMFGRGKGGIEQAFLDYCHALLLQGNQVTAILHPDAAIREQLLAIPNLSIKEIANSGQWDVRAMLRLQKLFHALAPDAAIAHGVRAATLLRRSARNICPVIGVTHNYSTKRLLKLDALFTITDDLKRRVLETGYPEARVFSIPNMIALPLASQKEHHDIPTIGAMGRMVKKKGFEVLLHALAELDKRNIIFKVLLAGNGEEENNIRLLANKLHLEDKINFMGWVEDKDGFFSNVDIFCLPSLHEPFGIVLLEAFAHGVPTITTDTEGPSEIATHRQNALIVPKNDPAAMADALALLLQDKQLAASLAENALETIRTRYDIKIVSATLQQALEQVVQHYG